MARKWTRSDYAKAAKQLKRFGYDISYKANDRKTFRQRGIIRRLYDEKISYIRATQTTRSVSVGEKPEVYTFKFQKLSRKERNLAIESGLFSREQFTKGGIFLEKPANLKASEYKVTFSKRGVRIKGGDRLDRVVRLDSKTLAVDPHKAVQDAVDSLDDKNFKRISIIAAGRRTQHESLSLKQFYHYLSIDGDNFLGKWIENNQAYAEKFGGDAFEAFVDVFHLRLLYR